LCVNFYNRGSRLYHILNDVTQRFMLQHILDGTKEGAVDLNETKERLNITEEAIQDILEQLSADGLITRKGDTVSATVDQRIELAVRAIKLGADFEKVSKSLGWLEFEELVARVFRENGYNTKSRYRFKAEGRRWEIDVLATSYPYIVCAECKHYTSGMGNSTARKIIEIHIEKTEVLSKHIEDVSKKIGVQSWKNAILVPISLTLSPTKMNIYRRVPSVSVLMLPSFLDEFPGYLERVINYPVDIPEYKPKPKQLRLG
jgi:DNA-binding Lrp family transcriptional regulator